MIFNKPVISSQNPHILGQNDTSIADLFSSNENLSKIPQSDYEKLLNIINKMGLESLFTANNTSTEERVKIIQDIYEIYVLGNTTNTTGCTNTNPNGEPATNPDGTPIDSTVFPPLAQWHHERFKDENGRWVTRYIPTNPNGDYDFTVEINDEFMVNTEADIWGLVENLKEAARDLEISIYDAIGKEAEYDIEGGYAIISGEGMEEIEVNKQKWFDVMQRVEQNRRSAVTLMDNIIESSILMISDVNNFVNYVKNKPMVSTNNQNDEDYYDDTNTGGVEPKTATAIYNENVNTMTNNLTMNLNRYNQQLQYTSSKLIDETSDTLIEIKSLDNFYNKLIEGYDMIKEGSTSLRKFINEVRPVQYKAVKNYFSFIKGLEESTKAINAELTLEVEKIKEQRLKIINDGIISNSEHKILPIDKYNEYRNNDKKLYIFNPVNSQFVELLNVSRLSKIDSLTKAMNGLYLQVFKNEDGEIIPRNQWSDILNSAYKNFETENGTYIIDDELYTRFGTIGEYNKLYNIPIPSRSEIFDKEYDIYYLEEEPEIVEDEPPVGYDDDKDYINNLNKYISDEFSDDDKKEFNNGYLDFKKNVLSLLINRGQYNMKLDNVISLLNSTEISFDSEIKDFLTDKFYEQLKEYIEEIRLTDYINLENILNEFTPHYIDQSGNIIYIVEKTNLRRDVSKYIEEYFKILLNKALYPSISKSFISNNNVDINILNGDEYTLIVALSNKIGVFYNYNEYCRILIDRIIGSNQDYNTIREIKFVRIPYNTRDVEMAINNTNENDIFNFHEITSKDKYWKDSEEDVLKHDFNMINSKFYSIEDSVNEYVMVNQLSYMFHSLYSFRKNNNYNNQLEFLDGDINSNPIDLLDGIISMGILVNRISGMKTDPIYNYDDVKYLLGFNNFNDDAYFIKYRNTDTKIEFTLGSIAGTDENSNWFIGNVLDVYPGQYIRAHYVDGGVSKTKELLIKEVVINDININLSQFRTFDYVNNTNVGIPTSDDNRITIELMGIDIDTSDNANGYVGKTFHFNRFSTIEEIVDNYFNMNSIYDLDSTYMKTEIGNLLSQKNKLSKFLTNVNSKNEYNKLKYFIKLQTHIKYTRDMFEIQSAPGTYFETYLDYLDDNSNYDELVSWLKCDEISNFNNLTFDEKKEIYKNKLIRLIDDMISYISDPKFASYFNNTNYIFYMKSMIKTVLLFFKSYTIDLLPIDTKYLLNDFNTQNVKIDDEYNVSEKKVIPENNRFKEEIVSNNLFTYS